MTNPTSQLLDCRVEDAGLHTLDGCEIVGRAGARAAENGRVVVHTVRRISPLFVPPS